MNYETETSRMKCKRLLISLWWKVMTVVAIALGAIGLASPGSALAAAVPTPASAVGYVVNTFSSDFQTSNVDLGNSQKAGFAWYPWNLFGHHAKTSAIVLNADHSVTLMGDVTGPNGEILSASGSANTARFVGTAFGGGAYIEAELKFDPTDVSRPGSIGWPSFWSATLESSILHQAQWPGQAPGYIHATEADFLEYMLLKFKAGPVNAYSAGLHEWYGIPNVTCPRGLCDKHTSSRDGVRLVPQDTDFTQYHRYGFLWVTATSHSMGYVRFYFDGNPVGVDQDWTQFADQPPPPDQPWTFGWLDRDHLVLILGTGPNEPLTVRSVNVWQASALGNLHQ